MTDKLPPNLLALFAPRPALRYLPPIDHPPEERRTANITGLAEYLPALRAKAAAAAASDAKEISEDDPRFEPPPTKSWLEKHYDKIIDNKKKQEELVKTYKPHEDPEIRGDPYSTLFVARLPYDIQVRHLENVFLKYGPIQRIRIVTVSEKSKKVSKRGRPTGYAFVRFENEEDMKKAYKSCVNLYIGNRKVVVDCERGRTVANWKPRRVGGGLGGRHYTKEQPPAPAGGGYGSYPYQPRGGYRGGGGYQGRGRGGGGGGFRGGRGGPGGGGGGRGGMGYSSNGYPPNAPPGPRSRGGYGQAQGYGGNSMAPRGGGHYDDRGPRDRYGYGGGSR